MQTHRKFKNVSKLRLAARMAELNKENNRLDSIITSLIEAHERSRIEQSQIIGELAQRNGRKSKKLENDD